MECLEITLSDLSEQENIIIENQKRFNVISHYDGLDNLLFQHHLVAKFFLKAANSKQFQRVACIVDNVKTIENYYYFTQHTFKPLIKHTNFDTIEFELFRMEFFIARMKADLFHSRRFDLVIIHNASKIQKFRQFFNFLLLPTLADNKDSKTWILSNPEKLSDFNHFFQLGFNGMFTEQWTSFELTK